MTALDWKEPDRMLTGLAGRRAKLDAEEAIWLREAKRRGTWMELGFATMLAYMDGRLGYAPRTARDRLRVAESLERLPEMTAALATGALPWSAVRELTRIVTPKTESAWIESATGKNVREIQELVGGRAVGDLPDDKPRDDIHVRDVTLELTPSAFAILRQARSVLEAEAGGPLSDDQLVEALCRRTLEGKADRAAHQVAITTCRHCARGWQDGGGARVQLAPDEVERALCDAEHVGAIDDGVPTRAHQDVTPATRRFVLHRDGGKCVVAGCRSARNLDLHHVVSRMENGSHEASNLVTLCSAHHRALHAGTLKPDAVRAHVGARGVEHEAYAAFVTTRAQKGVGRKAVKKARSSVAPSAAATG